MNTLKKLSNSNTQAMGFKFFLPIALVFISYWIMGCTFSKENTLKKDGNSEFKYGYELENGLKQDLIYEIINSSRIPEIKMSIDVRLKQRVSQEALELIARNLFLENEGPSYDHVFITYYLPDMVVGSGAWSTSHFNPTLEINILGLTVEEEQVHQKRKYKTEERCIGKWVDEALPAIVTICHENDGLRMDWKLTRGNGAIIKMEVIENTVGGQVRFQEKKNNINGEYYVIDSQDNLNLYDNDGFIRKAPSFQ